MACEVGFQFHSGTLPYGNAIGKRLLPVGSGNLAAQRQNAAMTKRPQITSARKAAGLSLEDLSDRTDISTSQLSRIETGKREPRVADIEKIAKAVGVDPSQLLDSPGDTDVAPIANFRPPQKFFSEAATMPVYAAAEGGNGSLIITTEPLEYVKRPYTLEAVSEAYAILIVGESMDPAYEPGDTAWVNPRLPPMRGTDVILYSLEDEAHATIKRLIGWTETEWHLRQYNPPKDFKLKRKEWSKCHRVVGKFARR